MVAKSEKHIDMPDTRSLLWNPAMNPPYLYSENLNIPVRRQFNDATQFLIKLDAYLRSEREGKAISSHAVRTNLICQR